MFRISGIYYSMKKHQQKMYIYFPSKQNIEVALILFDTYCYILFFNTSFVFFFELFSRLLEDSG